MKKKEITFEMVTTRGGDHGESSLYNGERRRKDDLVFEVVGDLDELGSFLGLARATLTQSGYKKEAKLLLLIQKTLFIIGGEAAMPPEDTRFSQIRKIKQKHIEFLEVEEKHIFARTSIPPAFVTAGANINSAQLDICRTIARRCERKVVTVIRTWGWNHLSLSQIYLNRLSDLLFVLARSLE